MANSYEELYEIIKEIALQVMKDEEPTDIQFGVVTKLDPFTVDLGDFEVSTEDDMLTVTRTVQALIDNDSCCSGCDHCSGATCRFGKLGVGDSVVCLRSAGGDDWLVLDAAEVEDDE